MAVKPRFPGVHPVREIPPSHFTSLYTLPIPQVRVRVEQPPKTT